MKEVYSCLTPIVSLTFQSADQQMGCVHLSGQTTLLDRILQTQLTQYGRHKRSFTLRQLVGAFDRTR